MSKLKNIAVFSAMLVGVMIYTSPAKSAVCFLPDDDGSCGGGDIEISDGSDPDKPEEKCEDYPVSAADYEKMKNCFNFESCTKSKTKEIKYKQGGKISGTSWNAGSKVCCTDGETYDSTEGQCCPSGGCTHECDAPKEWSSTLRSCECPADREENDNHECCPVGEHADGTICCPEKKHNENGKCVCDSQYNTDKDGNCVTQTISKPTITITYKEAYNSLTPDTGSNADEYYYKTLRFTTKSSDDIKRDVQMKTYPAKTCKTQYTTTSPVIIKEAVRTIYKSLCGAKSETLPVSSIAALDTFIDGTKVYSFNAYNTIQNGEFDGLDGKTVETNDYIVKFVKSRSCADLGYVSDYCSSEHYAHYTGVVDSYNDKCYTCEPYDSKKTCKEIGLQFGKNLVGEETGCAGSGIEGKVFTYEWAYDEAGDFIQGSDGDCMICKPVSDVNIYTSNSKCYKITSITGDSVVKIDEQHYSVPLEASFTINAEKDLTSSKWNTGYCKSIYPYIEIDNMSSAYERTKQYSYKESKTFTLNDDFLNEYKIVENEMRVSPIEEPSSYTATLYLENDDCPYVEGICPTARIVSDDASNNEYMKDVSVENNITIDCCGYKDGCGNPFTASIWFDGMDWLREHYTSGDCEMSVGSSEFTIYKGTTQIGKIKGTGCTKINEGAIEICIEFY